MSVNASWLRMFVEMSRRHRISGPSALALGVQDVMFTHGTAEDLLRDRRTKVLSVPPNERTFHLSRNQRQFTQDSRHYMSVQDLYRMMGFSSLETLDAFENDKPDHLWDLCTPIPEAWHNKYDVVFDIGVLEHTCDIFQALENVANLVKPGGWMILYLPMVSPINSCLYHPNPPFYFDILSRNGFENFDAWINWMPDWDQQNDIRTIWLNYQYNDDVYIWRPRYYTVMWFMAQKREHVGSFSLVLQNFYKEWHAGKKLFATTEDQLLHRGSVPAMAEGDQRWTESGFRRGMLRWMRRKSVGETSAWAHPTAMSRATATQIARFPLNEMGIPYADTCVVAPIDSQLQKDIPEQMLVGNPAREQLYL
jgi:SAM-dependent methyltransferase